MNSVIVDGDGARVSLLAAWLAIAAVATALVLLASLHVLSPEFDPAWRMVSEYANGRYGWVLSLMFAAWGVSTLALAAAIRAAARATRFKVGVALLATAGVGEVLASVFDLNHDTLHSLAGALGIPCLPLAALLISGSLGRTPAWAAARRLLRWTAHLTWVSVAL